MTQRVYLVVGLDAPAGATAAEMRDYVETEVRAGSGARDPKDPVFCLDRASVEVQPAPPGVVEALKARAGASDDFVTARLASCAAALREPRLGDRGRVMAEALSALCDAAADARRRG